MDKHQKCEESGKKAWRCGEQKGWEKQKRKRRGERSQGAVKRSQSHEKQGTAEEAWKGKLRGGRQGVRISNMRSKQGKAVKSKEGEGKQKEEEEGDRERLKRMGKGNRERGKEEKRGREKKGSGGG